MTKTDILRDMINNINEMLGVHEARLQELERMVEILDRRSQYSGSRRDE